MPADTQDSVCRWCAPGAPCSVHEPPVAVEVDGTIYIEVGLAAEAVAAIPRACEGCLGPAGAFRRRVEEAAAEYQGKRRQPEVGALTAVVEQARRRGALSASLVAAVIAAGRALGLADADVEAGLEPGARSAR